MLHLNNFLLLISSLCATVWSHGRLLEPPSRTSMWRFGYNTPPDYDDNGHNCGGVGVQFGKNDGKCGICGDPYDGYRESEAGGPFAQGIITRTYKTGGILNVLVQITANHKGYFEFHLCPHNNPKRRVTQECLDRYPLRLLDGKTKYFLENYLSHSNFTLSLILPSRLTCTQCVLQWKYTAGNTYNCDPVLDKCCTGCGNQEQFYACADIAITDKDDGSFLPDLAPKSTGNRQSTPTSHIQGTTKRPNKKGFPPKYARKCRARSDLKPHEQFNHWCKVMCEVDDL